MYKCNKCNKCILNKNHILRCKFCNSNYHKRCVYGNHDDDNWMCFDCSGNLFPFNHIIDNDEFKFALCYFNNSVEYNKLLNLKFNPYLYECTAQDNIGQINLDNYNTCNSCNYVFDLSLDSKCSFKGVLHPWALYLMTLCIFSKNKATSDKLFYGSGQKCSKELKNHSFTSVETIVVKLQ